VIGSRIKQLRAHLRLNQTDFGRALGITHGAISHIEMDKNMPSSQLLTAMSAIYGVNREWLETGKGPMFLEPPAPSRFISELDERISRYNLDKLSREAVEDALNMVEALVEILTAEEEQETKTSIRNNLRTFQEKVREKKELIEYRKRVRNPSDETDRASPSNSDKPKTGSSRGRKHLGDKHRAGGR